MPTKASKISQAGTPAPPKASRISQAGTLVSLKTSRVSQTGTPAPPNRHLKLIVAYDGTQYAGWQLQPNGKTVQEVMETAFAKIDGREVRVYGSGRTDAGVHARGQVANCTVRTQLKAPTLLKALNAKLPEDVRVLRGRRRTRSFMHGFPRGERNTVTRLIAAPWLIHFCAYMRGIIRGR